MNCLPSRWLKECEQLTIHNQTYTGDEDLVTNGSLVRLLLFNLLIQILSFPFFFQDIGPEFCQRIANCRFLVCPCW